MDTDIYNQITEYLINHSFPLNWTSEQRRQLRQQSNHYIVQDNLLFKRNKDGSPLRVILKDDVARILYNMHSVPNAGHFGIKATIDKTRQRYFWPTMGTDIKKYHWLKYHKSGTYRVPDRWGGRAEVRVPIGYPIGARYDYYIKIKITCIVATYKTFYLYNIITKVLHIKPVDNKILHRL